MSRTLIMMSVICVVVAASTGTSRAEEWAQDGNSICTTPELQRKPRIAPDGAGGAIVVWEDNRDGEYDIFAQRVDDLGNPLWDENGVAICSYSGSQRYPDVAADGAGGAFFVWNDYRSEWTYDVYAQRIDADGNVQWSPGGIAICTAEDYQYDPTVIYDGTGGAVFLWDDFRSLASSDVFAQRVDGDGVIQWAPDGIAVCAAGGSQYHSDAFTDGSGGAIVVWGDYRSGSTDINVYAQWIDHLGVARWTADGVAVTTAPNSQNEPAMAPDGSGGAIVGWVDYRNEAADIYAQRIDAAGTAVWAADGISVCAADDYQSSVRVVSDGAGGAVFAWTDARGVGQDIYAQRLDESGSLLWAADGAAVSTASNDQSRPAALSGETGGAIIVWQDMRSGSANDVYGQFINASGAVEWTPNGVALTTASNNQSYPAVAPDGSGGAIAVWEDLRDGNYDIYAQRVMNTGHVGGPAPSLILVQDVPYDQGGRIQLMWLPSPLDVSPNNDITHYIVWRKYPVSSNTWESVETVAAQNSAAYLVSVDSPVDSIGSDTGWQHFKVSAHTADPSDFYETPIDSGYSVDNIPPQTPQDFSVAFNTGGGNHLTWQAPADVDLDHYTIYRGTTADFTPTPDDIVATTSSTSWTDPDHDNPMVRYKLSASDLTGNECVPTAPTTATGIDCPVGATAFALHDAVPNPFNPTTRIDFEIARAGLVSIRIYDALGRHVRTLVDETLPEGRHRQTWNGTNGRGERVATGVYFCKMTTGGFTQTRRLVLLK